VNCKVSEGWLMPRHKDDKIRGWWWVLQAGWQVSTVSFEKTGSQLAFFNTQYNPRSQSFMMCTLTFYCYPSCAFCSGWKQNLSYCWSKTPCWWARSAHPSQKRGVYKTYGYIKSSWYLEYNLYPMWR
jgi:hypothetical protein